MVSSSKNKSIAFIAVILVAAYCHLEFSATKNIRLLESKPLDFPYDNTCPLLCQEYLGNGVHPEEAQRFYANSGAPTVMQKGLSKISTEEQQNIVFVGDSNMRQIYMSIASQPPYNDARLKLRNSSELFFSPKAGKIQMYSWKREWDAMITDDDGQDWLQSCKNREIFAVDTYSLFAPNEHVREWSKLNPVFETVPLGSVDKVIINASMHGVHGQGRREHNLNRLNELLDCMADAREKGEDPGWPQLYYFRTNQLHFKTKDGGFASEKDFGCADYKDSMSNEFIKAEVDMLRGKIPLVGYGLNLDHLGRLHMGGRDCAHWSMPGVPDVFGREIMNEVFLENEGQQATLKV
ncbi:hypothetical protein CTEN210_08226 [Chaetoceros tenuissimus]|uniref:Uncharacterized protein n=1 Tax=Chaetoceros tenuissimus TaxID=426638 RepID=A0AAD3CVK7_9STRA|nr:hypothetical protein CTEN210_08226 [Chaetoceros tenuissimus]